MNFVTMILRLVGQTIPEFWLAQLVNNLNWLRNAVAIITESTNPNGSFEFDNDSDDIPDGYERVLGTGGSGTIIKTGAQHGAWAYEFTRALGGGNSGGSLTTEDFIVVSPGEFSLELWYRASAAVRTTLEILWFDDALGTLGSTVVATIEEATAWRRYFYEFNPEKDVRFAKLRLNGATTAVDLAGSVAFDGVSFKQTEYESYDLTNTWNFNITSNDTWFSPTSGGTLEIFIPEDITTLSIEFRAFPEAASNSFHFELDGFACPTSPELSVQTDFVLSLVVDAGSKGTYATLSVFGRRSNSSAPNPVLQLLAPIVNGRNDNIILVP